MGLTSSYQKFMRTPHQSIKTFYAAEADGPDDAASFSRLFRQDQSEHLISVEKNFHGDEITLTKRRNDMTEHPNTPSLDKGEASAAEVAKTPWRVSLDKMKEQVDTVEYIYPETIPHMTIAVVVLKNGYALQGMSAPADPANFNEEKGKEFAYEDALRKLRPLEAYVMREYLSGGVEIHDPNGRWSAT